MALSFNAVKKFFDFEIENAEYQFNNYDSVDEMIDQMINDEEYWICEDNITVYVNIKSKKTGEIVATQEVEMGAYVGSNFDIADSYDWDDDFTDDEKREYIKEKIEELLDAEFEGKEEDEINDLFEEAYEEWSYDEDEIIEAINNEAA